MEEFPLTYPKFSLNMVNYFHFMPSFLNSFSVNNLFTYLRIRVLFRVMCYIYKYCNVFQSTQTYHVGYNAFSVTLSYMCWIKIMSLISWWRHPLQIHHFRCHTVTRQCKQRLSILNMREGRLKVATVILGIPMISPFLNAIRRQTFGNSGRNSISSLEHYSTLVQVAVVVLFIKKKKMALSPSISRCWTLMHHQLKASW